MRRADLGPDGLVVEVASNDGYLLKEFADLGVPVPGLEHVKASAEAALALGVPTEQERVRDGVGREARRRGAAAPTP